MTSCPSTAELVKRGDGCLFCGMGDTPRQHDGKPAHFVGHGGLDVIYCTRGAQQEESKSN